MWSPPTLRHTLMITGRPSSAIIHLHGATVLFIPWAPLAILVGRLRLRRLLHPERFRQARSLPPLFQPCTECERQGEHDQCGYPCNGNGSGNSKFFNPRRGNRSTPGSRLSSSNARPSASAVMNRRRRQGSEHGGRISGVANFASSGSSRNMGNTNGAARNSARQTRS